MRKSNLGRAKKPLHPTQGLGMRVGEGLGLGGQGSGVPRGAGDLEGELAACGPLEPQRLGSALPQTSESQSPFRNSFADSP